MKYKSLLRKMTCKDKGSCESSPPCRGEACAQLLRTVSLLKETHTNLKEKCTNLKETHTNLKEKCTNLKETHTNLKEKCTNLKETHTNLKEKCTNRSRAPQGSDQSFHGFQSTSIPIFFHFFFRSFFLPDLFFCPIFFWSNLRMRTRPISAKK